MGKTHVAYLHRNSVQFIILEVRNRSLGALLEVLSASRETEIVCMQIAQHLLSSFCGYRKVGLNTCRPKSKSNFEQKMNAPGLRQLLFVNANGCVPTTFILAISHLSTRPVYRMQEIAKASQLVVPLCLAPSLLLLGGGQKFRPWSEPL